MKNKSELLQEIEVSLNLPYKGTNSMGCDERNYNPYFLIRHCFEYEELETLEYTELKRLVKLAEHASDAFY